MARHYDLVGSIYDKYARGNKYREEEIIKIPGVTFKSIEDIDKFTADFIGSDELKSMIDKKYQNKTVFSIRVTIDDENFYYKSIIYNNPNLVKITNSLKPNTIYTVSGPRTVKMYLGNDDLFMDAWDDVENKIFKSKTIKEDRKWLYSVFGEKSGYTTLINRYINGDAFDIETNKILVDLEIGFRNYEVFRKYLINKDKVENKSTVSNINVTSTTIPIKTNLDAIERKHGKSFSYVPLDDEGNYYDKEEFFDEDEIRMMSDGDDNVPYHFTGRKI